MHAVTWHLCFRILQFGLWTALDRSHDKIVLDTQDAHGSPLKHLLTSVQVFALNSKGWWIRLWGTSIHKQ